MNYADDVWRGKTDDQVADAARHLSDYTEEGEQTIRKELRRRGMAEPPPTQRPIDEISKTSPVVRRYRDAYRVGAALVSLGNSVKIVGAILGGIILIGSLSSANSPFGGGGFILMIGIVAAVISGGLFWVCGVMVAAQGQILQATLDNAVASSHFLTDAERANAMGLPSRAATDQSGQINDDKEICPFCKEPSLKINKVCEVCKRQKR